MSRVSRTITTTYYGPGGTRQTTETRHGDQLASNFGDMKISYGRTKPSGQARYSKGWGSAEPTRRQAKGPPMQLKGKTFQEIRAQCLREGRLFEDPDFPAVESSIYYSRPSRNPLVWKRPTELVDRPELFVGGVSRFDVKQGEIGNCWMVAAAASLCDNEKLLHGVVPKDQGFSSGEEYAGIFHFHLWQYGKWVDVIIDDRLPTKRDHLVFVHSAEKSEFWTPLLEKAYAKLVGSYEGLMGGCFNEAMEDFTGGITETIDFRKDLPPDLFALMLKANRRSSTMGCSIEAPAGQQEAELTNGLIMGHAYSITSVKMVNMKSGRHATEIPLVRVRNPWGNEREWKGAWSDRSVEWNLIKEEDRRRIDLTFEHDGEFWMSFEDFSSQFEKLQICRLGPDSYEDGIAASKRRWESTGHHGAWKRRVSAGGCSNYRDTFWTNPQYRVEVIDPDEEDEDDTGTIVVGLLQKYDLSKQRRDRNLLTIGYAIYELKNADAQPLDKEFFRYNRAVAKSPAFVNMREVCGRHKLPPGHYCILPSTFEPNCEGEFLLRIFSEKPATSQEIDEETEADDVQQPQSDVKANDQSRDEELHATFRRVSGTDMAIDAFELQGLVNATFKDITHGGFSVDACRSMVALMDVDRSGKLDFEEFKELWNDLVMWKGVFVQYDSDHNGYFNSYELRNAFHGVGFKVSNSTFNTLVQRYSDREGKMYFDDFAHCIVRMKTMFEIYEGMKNGNTAEFTKDQFIQTTMYS